MPRGDGTGPAGQGPGTGRGAGRRGGGAGTGGRMGGFAMGPGGYCVCTRCNTRTAHTRGVPCTSVRCPKCGAQMTRPRG